MDRASRPAKKSCPAFHGCGINPRMKASVVIPTLNAGAYLAEALDSVGSQTRPPDEVLVVDGGSTDNTLAIAHRYPFVRCMTQEGRGLSDAWNCGVRASKGDAVALLDSDDIWLPEKLERQLACFAAHPEVEVVLGRVQFFLSPGQSRPPGFKQELFEGTHEAPMPGAMLVRRATFERIGWFDPALRVTPDIAWFARLRRLQIPTKALPELVIRKRVHAVNLSLTSAQTPLYVTELLQVLHNLRRHPQALTRLQFPLANSGTAVPRCTTALPSHR